MSRVHSTIAVILVITCQKLALAKDNGPVNELGNLERVLAFAVQQEVQTSGVKNRKDLCVGFGHGLVADQEAVISELRRNGLKVHPNEWCNRGPRGLSIGIIAPVRETAPGMYELVLELADLSIRQGEHFATLLRRGTYVIRCETGSEPRLVSYRETCCAKTGAPRS
jgi:hypothetical protein